MHFRITAEYTEFARTVGELFISPKAYVDP